MYNKVYSKHIYNVFVTRLITITLIFSCLIFIMNILEEIKFFSNSEQVGLGYPVLLTVLNLPSVIFEIFPFIILITTQFFFIKFQEKEELLIFKNNGINNLKIIFHISLLVFIIGIILITLFHLLSSNMKNSYIEFKNSYTQDNKYLAMINENGLWIKDKLNDQIMIIHSETINKNQLNNLVITTFDNEFRIEENIIAKQAIITSNIWSISDAVVVNSSGERLVYPTLNFSTNFDYAKINSLFSNLESLNIFELFDQRKDFESVGLNISDIDIYIHKIFSLPFNLIIFSILSSILMLNINFKKSKTSVLIIGILLSVVIYYIYYFFGLLGSTNKIPILLAIWLPNLLIFLSCMVGIININDK